MGVVGGHTAEMIPLLRALGVVDGASPYRHVEFVVADTDSTSRGRVEAAQVRPQLSRAAFPGPWSPTMPTVHRLCHRDAVLLLFLEPVRCVDRFWLSTTSKAPDAMG